eukprot:jgi/Tetstr1/435412/TSEL_024321.t1
MQASSGLIYYGLGRMLSYISPAVIAGANLSNCNFAMVLDKANNIPASERQNIVMNTAYATVDANHAVMEGVLEGLKQGLTIGAAHLKSVRELQCELEYMKYNAVLYGLPFMRDAAAK